MVPVLSSAVFPGGFKSLLGGVVWCRGAAVFNQGSRADSVLLVDTGVCVSIRSRLLDLAQLKPQELTLSIIFGMLRKASLGSVS